MSHTEDVLISLTGILFLGVGAQWLAATLRMPSILVLLSTGFLAGPVTGILQPDKLLGDLLFPTVSLAVCVVLFEGSLGLRFNELQSIAGPLRNLLTVGVLVTWICCTLAARFLLGMQLSVALLLGAILVVTGPTVVGPMLQHIRPVGSVGRLAKWEGIVVDPVGAVLAVLVFETVGTEHTSGLLPLIHTAVVGIGTSLVVGLGMGMAGAWLLACLLRRHWIADHLQSPVTLMMVVTAFTLSNRIQHESGLVAVTVMGIALANLVPMHTQPIRHFKEDLSVLLISSLFIVLTARLQLQDFATLSWRGAAFVAIVIVVVRPLSVAIACWRSNLSIKERVFLGWLAPRGIVAAAVSSVFALRMGEAGRTLAPATFLVIAGTVIVYGITAGPLAYCLGLAVRNPQGLLIAGAHAAARAVAQAVHAAGFPVLLVDINYRNIAAARQSGLPAYCANILSEEAFENLDLGGIGQFLALTPNDEVNSLAAMHFSELFGRGAVYQLAPDLTGKDRIDTSADLLKGRTAFAEDATYSLLQERFASGYLVKTTRLSSEFTLEDFRKHYGETAIVLFVITESGRLRIATADPPPNPRAGQTIVALVPPVDRPT